MSRFYAVEGWALILLGTVHMAATFRFYYTFEGRALWFFGGGMLMALVGAVNLLNRVYGSSARGLRLVCIAANLAILPFAIAAGVLGRAGLVQWIVVLGIVGPLTALSFLRSVQLAKS